MQEWLKLGRNIEVSGLMPKDDVRDEGSAGGGIPSELSIDQPIRSVAASTTIRAGKMRVIRRA